jgi:hypothetical protein
MDQEIKRLMFVGDSPDLTDEDRGPTYEGVDYRGCTRCKVRL